MSSEKLKKYLAYYQKTLREDPENVEARLRLAALFREMGHKSNAIEEYVTASKLLAAQGLPLEAIAACKAVLEIDPTHTEVQFFLARLFALAPDAAGARVARPVLEVSRNTIPEESKSQAKDVSGPITLSRPKIATPLPDSLPTQHRPAVSRQPEPAAHPALTMPSRAFEQDVEAPHDEVFGLDELPTHRYKALNAALLAQAPPGSLTESTRAAIPALTPPSAQSEATRASIEVSAQLLDDLRRTTEMDAHLRRTVEFSYLDELRETQAIDPAKLMGIGLEEATSPTTRALFHTQQSSTAPSSALTGTSETVVAAAISSPASQSTEETFELRVFELDEVDITSEVIEQITLEEIPSDASSEDATSKLDRTTISILRSDLPEIPLFSHVSAASFVGLLTMSQIEEIPVGHTILRPGHQRRSLFIIISGQVIVSKAVGDEEVCLTQMQEGDFFGEFGLLTGRDHSATVRATLPCRLLVISEEAIHHVAQEDPSIWDTLWSYYHVRMLNNLMSSHGIFGKLNAHERDELLDLFELQEFTEGQVIVNPQEPCHFVYLVLFGLVELTPTRDPHNGVALRDGEFFGFLPSLTDDAGYTTVTALKDTTLLCLPSKAFRTLTRQNTLIAAELRHLLRTKPNRSSLFLTGMTRYAETGSAE